MCRAYSFFLDSSHISVLVCVRARVWARARHCVCRAVCLCVRAHAFATPSGSTISDSASSQVDLNIPSLSPPPCCTARRTARRTASTGKRAVDGGISASAQPAPPTDWVCVRASMRTTAARASKFKVSECCSVSSINYAAAMDRRASSAAVANSKLCLRFVTTLKKNIAYLKKLMAPLRLAGSWRRELDFK